jgi:hypothetical protein
MTGPMVCDGARTAVARPMSQPTVCAGVAAGRSDR